MDGFSLSHTLFEGISVACHNTTNPLYRDTRYTAKIRYKEVTDDQKLCKNIVFNASNKYTKDMFSGEIPFLTYHSPALKILYNSKFILMTTSLGTNIVVVTRVHYT